MTPDSAIVLLSGGMDSATCLAIALSERRHCIALSVRYGQRNERELECARRLAGDQGVHHQIIEVGLDTLGGSALTDGSALRRSGSVEEISAGEIPNTYVPARNLVLLALGAATAEVHGATELFIGVNNIDYSGYPDCRPEFIESFEQTANLATRAATEQRRRLNIRTPLLGMSKAEIVSLGLTLGVNHASTLSCYDPAGELACGVCDACVLRLRGFAQVDMEDPAAYAVGGQA